MKLIEQLNIPFRRILSCPNWTKEEKESLVHQLAKSMLWNILVQLVDVALAIIFSSYAIFFFNFLLFYFLVANFTGSLSSLMMSICLP